MNKQKSFLILQARLMKYEFAVCKMVNPALDENSFVMQWVSRNAEKLRLQYGQ